MNVRVQLSLHFSVVLFCLCNTDSLASYCLESLIHVSIRVSKLWISYMTENIRNCIYHCLLCIKSFVGMYFIFIFIGIVLL